MKQIEFGTKVIGNWGAMFPLEDGVITSVEGSVVKIHWESREVSTMDVNDIFLPGERSRSGSPVGIFVNEE